MTISTPAAARTALTARRTLRDLDGAPATTSEQRDALEAWTGWGSLASAFAAGADEQWGQVRDDLDELVPDAALLDKAAEQLDTSFYTPRALVDLVFELLRSVGFAGGRVLEPGCGTGRFLSWAPADLDIAWTGVEIDPLSASIAKALHPDAHIRAAGLQDTHLPDEAFDVVIGNVPFSNHGPFDPAYPSMPNLHAYAIMRGLAALKQGGYAIVVTSRHTLDSDTTREALTGTTEFGTIDLIAALRLPAGAFADSGTEIVADILCLRKRAAGEDELGWTPKRVGNGVKSEPPRTPVTETVADRWSRPDTVSAYWTDRPDHLAGTHFLTGWQQSAITVTGDAADIERASAAVATSLVPQQIAAGMDDADLFQVSADALTDGRFEFVDDVLHQWQAGELVPAKKGAELIVLVHLRDAVRALVDAEADLDTPDSVLAPLRATAASLYAAYVAKYGALNRGQLVEGKPDPETGEASLSWRRPTLGGFRRDPDYYLVMAVEDYDQQTGEHAPAPILSRCVNTRPVAVKRVENAAEALAVCTGGGRGVDFIRIVDLLGLNNAAEAREALGDLIFDDPTTNRPVAARDYLSGNVRTKLADAIAANTANTVYAGTFGPQIDALTAIIPDDLGPEQVRVELGSPWLEVTDVHDFAREVLNTSVASLTYSVREAMWELGSNAHSAWGDQKTRLTYGTLRINPVQLLMHGLAGTNPVITDDMRDEAGKIRQVRNMRETVAATEKLRLIQERFATWVWEDEIRATRLLRTYNDRFNSIVPRTSDGSRYTFPGLAAEVTPWPHQRDAVDRIVSTERTLIGHAMGAGKTLTMILAARTLRQFGLAQKPLIVVPNHLLEQVAREARQAFPAGSFLIASKDDLVKDRRRSFVARCATGDWDAVMVTHQTFASIGVAPEAEARWVQDRKYEIADQARNTGTGRAAAKRTAKRLKAAEARFKQLRHEVADEDQLTIEHLGVDYFFVDETHMYRRLGVSQVPRAFGVSLGSSKRASDLHLKIEVLASRFPGKPIVSLLTGTPWSNSLAETWVWQRYLQPDVLEQAGVLDFVAWAMTFIRFETGIEVSPEGSGFRLENRPVGTKNLSGVRRMLSSVADLISSEQLELPRPEKVEHTHVSEPCDEMRAFVADLADRAEGIRNGTGDRDDNMLVICNQGRKAALDPALVGIAGGAGKLAEAADTIAKAHADGGGVRYAGSERPGTFQLVLCDLGTPKSQDAQTYGRLRRMLLDRGVPAAAMRFVHEATDDKARAALFAACNDGRVRILFGSTPKVGIGTNVQTRLSDIHHIDAPWLAAEVQQRDARGIRPGNQNSTVNVHRYVTEGTFDAFMWQTLERKHRAFAPLYASGFDTHETVDIGPAVLSYSAVKALATGNPLLVEHAEVSAEVARLRVLASVHRGSINSLVRDAESDERGAAEMERRADALEQVGAAIASSSASTTVAIIADLADRVCDRQRRDAYFRSSIGTEPRVTIQLERERSRIDVTFEVGLRLGATIELPRKLVRQGVSAVAAELTDQVQCLADGSAEASDRMRADADAWRARAVKSRSLASTSGFPQRDLLDQATRRLAHLDAVMLEEASRASDHAMAAETELVAA
ncbi:DEAD/DEAH box helicase family protein [Pseudoclavibacter sp. VKM Ac-2867]|uniref:DEAD/DEAH box helicase family protein n=1 Tax=Pseudoclavibacter sp. VKM Ac-2867 TaxID=2783829 RepID=UPI00188C6875|nr:DEAD/DEAH box helicase family protein [Pseudoclavibacter sp. VKM Ac-2867]MBF4459556.1 DEAD/DEAH box helicase family protein [Pseudoclavibacter sp. VKM Ac-2867]